MLSLWRMNISAAAMKALMVMGADPIASHVAIGRRAAAIKDPIDTIPVRSMESRNADIQRVNARGEIIM